MTTSTELHNETEKQMSYQVNVLSGGMVIDVCEFSSEDLAQKCADEYQDAGFKVQFVVKEM